MKKRKKIIHRGPPAHGAAAVVRKNRKLAKSYDKPVAPLPAIHIVPAGPVEVILPADVPVKRVKRQTLMERLFGRSGG
jgi:hypothetical protein